VYNRFWGRRFKILPAILTALDFAGLGNAALGPMFAMSKSLPAETFRAQVGPTIVKLFSRPNRAVRLNLLQHLPDFVDALDKDIINKQIFPAFVTGFTCVVVLLYFRCCSPRWPIIFFLCDASQRHSGANARSNASISACSGFVCRLRLLFRLIVANFLVRQFCHIAAVFSFAAAPKLSVSNLNYKLLKFMKKLMVWSRGDAHEHS